MFDSSIFVKKYGSWKSGAELKWLTVYRTKVPCYQRLSPRCLRVCVCGGGGGFYCTTEAASLIKGVIFCWDIRGNYATKSTVTECVKRLCQEMTCQEMTSRQAFGFLSDPGYYVFSVYIYVYL